MIPTPVSSFSAASGRGLIEAKGIEEPEWFASQSFPRHRAAASLKPELVQPRLQVAALFSAASGRGLIEAFSPSGRTTVVAAFSAASGRGLIEALVEKFRGVAEFAGFPRHRAAASLKPLELLDTYNAQVAVFRGIGPRPH